MDLNLFRESSVGAKACLIGVLVLLLLVPPSMLRALVSERATQREQAYAKVAEGWGGALTVGGPMLRIPVEQTVSEGDRTRVERRDLYLLPAKLDIESTLEMEPEPRYVGIYAVPVFMSRIHLTGQFDQASLRLLHDRPDVTYRWDLARLRLPVSDVRSLRKIDGSRFAARSLEFGPATSGIYSGIEAELAGFDLAQSATLSFDLRLTAAGTRSFSLLPLGSTTTASIHSNWPHPGFQGAFLPAERSVTDDGFDAQWQVLELNRAYGQTWIDTDISATDLLASAYGVELYQPVDAYQRAERAIKYAVLFIALTFLTFFAWEQVTRYRIHPLQYLLVGLALSMFYLLLIALSEHIHFALAYSIAAIALVAVIGIYLSGALRSRVRGATAAGAMTLVYGLLYTLILSEDYALLLGAIVLFAALATVMIATRRIDWYGAPATD